MWHNMSVFICKRSTLCRILEFYYKDIQDVLVLLCQDEFIKRLYRENVRAYCEWYKIPKTSDQYKELMKQDQKMTYTRPHRKYTPFHRFSATECWLYQCRNASLPREYDENGKNSPTCENILRITRDTFELGSYILAADLIRKKLVPRQYRDIGKCYCHNGKNEPVDVVHYYMKQNNIRPIWR